MKFFRQPWKRKHPATNFLKCIACFCLILATLNARSQHIPVSNNFTYQQFFTGLTLTGPWNNGATLNGWYAASEAFGLYDEFKTSAGGTSDHGLYSFGSNSDRALGSINQNESGNIAYGVLFSNSSGIALKKVVITMRAEQWRKVNTTHRGYQRVKVSYLVGNVINVSAAALLSNSFRDLPEAYLISRDTLKAESSLDGNLTENSAIISVEFPVTIPSGSQFFLRFLDENVPGIDVALAVDDLQVHFSSETVSKISVTSGYPFHSYLDQAVLSDIPGETPSNLYQVPTSQQLTAWTGILSDFFNGEKSGNLSVYGYDWVEFTQQGSGQQYDLVRKNNQSPFYWGTYSRRKQPINPTLTIQAPHPIKDRDTERQATSVFEITGASVLMVAGIDRCNNTDPSDCAGTTTICNGFSEKYRRSDVAHEVESIFHLATMVLANGEPDMKFVQLHGFAQGDDDPEFIVSAGLLGSMEKSGVDYPALFRMELMNSPLPGKSIKIPHLDHYSTLAAQDNVQGRFLNNYPAQQLCTSEVDPITVTNRFLHIEQYKTVRIDPSHYATIATILENVMDPANEYVPYINVSESGFAYEQNFNELSWIEGLTPWTNDLTLNGWHAAYVNEGMFGYYQAGDGSTSNFGLYSLGNNSDRALGALNQNASGDIAYGVLFRNTSGRRIDNIKLFYRAEQWRVSTAPDIQKVKFAYAILPTIDPTPAWLLSNGQFTFFDAGDLTTLHTSADVSQSLDGNQIENYIDVEFNVPITLNNSEYLFIRFLDDNAAGLDNSMALDNFEITFSSATTVRFKLAEATVNEGSGEFNIEISIENPSNGSTQFDLELADGHEEDIDGFTPLHVEVPPHQNSWSQSIAIIDDEELDPNEVLSFQIDNVTGGQNATGVDPLVFNLTIQDNDVPTVTFTSDAVTVSENIAEYEIELSVSPPVNHSFSIGVELLSTTGTTADIGNFVSMPVHFDPDNSGVAILKIEITNDLLSEDSEQFVFRLQTPQDPTIALGTKQTFTLTIFRNDLPAIEINEVLAFPSLISVPMKIDANGDGVFSAVDDEFVEFVNTESVSVDVSGWKVGDDQTRFTFPPSTILQPGEAVVIFGGYNGTPPERINGSRMFVVSNPNGLSLDNSGGQANIWNSKQINVASFSYGQSEVAQSLTRLPASENYVAHPNLNGKHASPGMKSNASVFVTQIRFLNSAEVITESHGDYLLRINCTSPTDVEEPTSFDLVLTKGAPHDIGNFTTKHYNLSSSTTEVTIPLAITNDDAVAAPRTFMFQIENLSGGVSPQLISPNVFELTINNDDESSVRFATNSVTVNESDGQFNIQVFLTHPVSDSETSIDVKLSNGDKDDLSGYETHTITFAANEISKDLPINLTNDGVIEQKEVFDFRLQNIQTVHNNVAIGTPDNFQLTINASDLSLIINEVHGSPSAISPPETGHGDANGDGFRASTEDEFIEFVNAKDVALDLSGWVVKTGSSQLVRHTFPKNTVVPARGSLVLFGGPTPTAKFGGSLVQVCNAKEVANISAAVTSTNGLISNSGSDLNVNDNFGNNVINYRSPDLNSTTASLTRKPDIWGPIDINTTHPLIRGTYFSPGTKMDGTAFITAVEFEKASDATSEDDGAYNLVIKLFRSTDEIVSPEFDVVLVSGNSDDLNNFMTRHVSVSSTETSITIPITITRDNLSEPDEEFRFEIRNIQNGYFTHVPDNQFKLTIGKPTGIEDNASTKIIVFPNPASSRVTISVPDESLSYNFDLADRYGKTIATWRNLIGTTSLNMERIGDGVYFYRITSGNRVNSIAVGKLWLLK